MSSDAMRSTADKPCLPPFAVEQRILLKTVLRDVSRSFYLTLRVLPREIRPQISLAYLLARATDTIADTKAVAKPERIRSLREFVGAGSRACPDLVGIGGRPRGAASTEERLLRRLPDCFAMLDSMSREDQRLIRGLLGTIVSGQIFDLEKFPGESERELVALANGTELDRYTYLVAGCVGEFWTKMCQSHLRGLNGLSIEDGVRFGKGLQLVNVLRDIPKDLRIGRCYLPVSEPQRLLDPGNFESVCAEYNRWLDTAVGHLQAGWQYTMQIPSSLARLRLACIWPIWIGLMTIVRLRTGNPLDPVRRIKISRGEVYGVMARSFLIVRNDAALSRAFQKLRDAASRR